MVGSIGASWFETLRSSPRGLRFSRVNILILRSPLEAGVSKDGRAESTSAYAIALPETGEEEHQCERLL
jgi:hypothetical protein